MPKSSVIQTGVDRLVDLIEQNKKITVAQAAKELSVPSSVVEEWASFLEEKEIIQTDFKFTNTYLIKKDVTKKELAERRRQMAGHREGFVRKVESTLAVIQKETAGLSKLKDDFHQLGDEVEDQVKKVKTDLDKLEKFDRLKRDLDQEIKVQNHEFHARLDRVNKELELNKKKYGAFLETIDNDEGKIDSELHEAHSLRTIEADLSKKVETLKNKIIAIEGGIKEEDTIIKQDEDELQSLKKRSQELRNEFQNRHEDLKKMISQSLTKEESISKIQDKILATLEKEKGKTKEKITSATVAQKKFEDFFNSKVKIDILVDKINTDVYKLQKELQGLKQEALVLDFQSKSQSVKDNISVLEKKFNEIMGKKRKFEDEILELYRMTHSKNS